jgi:hypothetical protein
VLSESYGLWGHQAITVNLTSLLKQLPHSTKMKLPFGLVKWCLVVGGPSLARPRRFAHGTCEAFEGNQEMVPAHNIGSKTKLCIALSLPAEREVMEACVRALDNPTLASGVHDLLLPQIHLFAARCVEADLSWFMSTETIPAKVSRVITEVEGPRS